MVDHISFNSFPARITRLSKDILTATKSVLEGGTVFNGRQTAKLRKQLKRSFPDQYITLTESGHAALLLAIKSLSLHPSDEILFPVNIYPTAFAVAESQATPVPVDCDQYGQMDPVALEQAITSKTRAIVVVHLYGFVGNLTNILTLAQKYHTTILEDCAQSFGTYYKGKPTGSFGDINCFSFYPTKNVFTFGDGGAILTKRKNVATWLSQAVSYGESSKYSSDFISGHSRISEFEAAVITITLRKFLKEKKKKQRLYEKYKKVLEKADIPSFFTLLPILPDVDPNIHLLVARTKFRDRLRAYLKRNGIETLIHYPIPIHQVRAFSSYPFFQKSFPNAEAFSRENVSLPFHSLMTDDEVHHVVSCIKNFFKKSNI